MNEHNSKKISFNKSILFSLKAELLKKQEEVKGKKTLPQHKIENFKPAIKTADSSQSDNKNEKNSLRDNLKSIDTDEMEACRKSKLALEKKAKLYDHLTDNAGESQLAGQFLVDFKEKKQIECNDLIEKTDEEFSVIPCNEEDDEEWLEFSDCLGRTRKCLKSDLALYKKRDEELLKVMARSHGGVEETDTKQADKPLLVQKTNDYLQSLREKWELKEKELLAKDKDIHYQDVLYDEARMHGIGYYSFSTDETERQKQMAELMKRRQETLIAQEEAETARKKRDELIEARVAAARARQRMRAGLPPEDPEEKKSNFAKHLLEFLNEKKTEADAKAKEEETKRKEEIEREKQKLRDAYIREWDLGKDGVEDKVKKFKEMTQEEYVEQQRSKRVDEFAPPQQKDSLVVKSKCNFDDHGRKIDPSKPKTWSEVRNMAPSTQISSDLSEPDSKGLYFSSKKSEKSVTYKNFDNLQKSTPIENELSDEEGSNCDRLEKRKFNANTEVAPPSTYEYYGPTPKYSKTEAPFKSDIRESFAKGNKSLESKSSGIHLPKHYDFTFD